jgi:predicted nucleotide-binding protein (sugar kinase/HSP70/actin superfamily)
MTLNPKSLPKGSTAKRKSTAKGRNRMTADEEKAVAKAYQEIKEGKVRIFKNADEYLKYLDTV